ncbi:helix-turn-helix domain-containing protein [Aquimarina sp. D1M17]|uniref:helix-turn-helix domain-containing protein n=1 Tax=Aquimarina acroporae TaxID=2937283 RepID=UPI0020BEFAF0|nr:helix-turn-helix domain-containing protein [Aquimarina acroporae]MCK8520818.1 helix-turn-helix domain-containing protein [Aquimarina acroporae]
MNKIFLLLFFFSIAMHAQKEEQVVSDSIQSKTYFQLYDLFFENLEKDPEKALVYANAYLKKGKKENKKTIISHGYFLLSHLYKDKKEYLIYADSIISLNKESKGKEYPARGYLLKGEYYLKKRQYEDAFENYKIANIYATRRSNSRIIYHSNRVIAKFKSRAGLHEEAVRLFKDCHEYAVDNGITKGVEDLLLLANELVAIDSLETALRYTKKGIKKSLDRKDEEHYNSFLLQAGVVLYRQKEYKKSLDSITKSQVYLENSNKQDELVRLYYYLGELHWILNKKKTSVLYYKKMDSIVQLFRTYDPIILSGYDNLKNYYHDLNYSSESDVFLKRQNRLDSLLKENVQENWMREVKIYQTFRIITGKDVILSDQKDEILSWKLFFLFAVFVFVICISVIIYLVKDRNRYQKSFRAIVTHTNKAEEPSLEAKEEKEKELKDLNISQDVIQKVIKGLDEFEKKERYLNKKYNLGILAKELHTNSSYLSKIINISKGKNFATYLHDLRVGYAIERLKDDRQFRLYSIKGISEEIGFKNSETFSKAFHKKTGIYPSSFISRLKQT